MEIVSPSPRHLLPNGVPHSVAILESFLWEVFPATCPAPSLESCSMEDKTNAGGERLQGSLIGREEGQGLLPGFRFLPALDLPLLIYLMASLSPSHPCLPPLLIFPPLLVSLSLSLISPLSCFWVFFFSCLVSASVSFAFYPCLCLLSVSFCVSLFSVSLIMSLFWCLSLCLCLSPPCLSPHLPSRSVSLHSQKSQV